MTYSTFSRQKQPKSTTFFSFQRTPSVFSRSTDRIFQDELINTLWAWMGAMGISPINGIVSPAYNVYTPNKRLDPHYVDALVRIPVFAEEATRFSKGVWSSRLRLYPEGFFEIWIPVPPLEEQLDIVAHIKRETVIIDAMRKAIEKTIGLSKERRAALIAAAVTGSIDVLREVA